MTSKCWVSFWTPPERLCIISGQFGEDLLKNPLGAVEGVSEMNEGFFCFWVQGLSDFGAGAHLTFIGEAKASRWPAYAFKSA
jgi:hypothetical protein